MAREGLAIRQSEALVRLGTMALIYVMAFSARLFSVIRYESIIHEFDPWFNYRSTKVFVEDGMYAFWNWFDHKSWYPLGRVVGGTVYPGIMFTAGFIYHALHALGFPEIHVREVCVLTAPIFSGLTAIAAYLLGTEAYSSGAGLFAAVITSIVPGYMSRSTAGSFDNEGVAITALVFVFYGFMRAVRTGSILYSALSAIAYLYMVSTWGGYIFVINIIPIYVMVMLVLGRFSNRLYVAYSTFYVLGTLLSMQIRFVGFGAIQSKEKLAALAVFGFLHLYVFGRWLYSLMPRRKFWLLFSGTVAVLVGTVAIALSWAFRTNFFGPWEGRFYTILDPTYAQRFIPIIASVSEHQPTAWASYFMDLHVLNFLFPVGLYYLMKGVTDTNLLLIVYAVFAAYFSGVMSRLMLVLAPASALMSGVALSEMTNKAAASVFEMVKRAPHDGSSTSSTATLHPDGGTASSTDTAAQSGKRGAAKKAVATRKAASVQGSASTASSSGKTGAAMSRPFKVTLEVSVALLLIASFVLFKYIQHCLYMANHYYSSPSVVIQLNDGSYWDDFREAYFWLSQNTDPDDTVLSWWDYGYQLSGMANRTTIVDNNTWNNSHIATVGRCLNSDEKKAHTIARKLDVDYVLIIFGGLVGYSSDDINKFLWPIRISGSVDPSVKEEDYLTARGEYSMGEDASETLKNSLMYRLSYYRFNEVRNHGNFAVDLVRRVQAPEHDITLRYFEEAFTSEHWLVRIYRVKQPDALGFT
ncbi:Dolichyl-diphosphooligosaccharide--protein glycosyltransferase subunit STT3 [Porphyridium purpureum]|uniref:dolichyl-diphosphooligosaccharide--protein glycotransferase n=1 Tax=Porphyridium purpureum TaxID=35688 RepID=A0A5J4Z678_PORPP|nr:Dolichyl-diphosphooligosaccharide--protein glycosyltransferase subunit STT3 [Porphyridium purpureum]|eukprot:POR7522..scf295_1